MPERAHDIDALLADNFYSLKKLLPVSYFTIYKQYQTLFARL
ncbi:hypothetical protein MuYL_4533 [Mucilaginibacter xinganensis]|uniref:Uncharacterized protein n=1 Tax=Mucilaginibacter xinganensis TaxID=1234841 RepID=A0A223P3J3_9SPHI|nr:hypothetical protein MuYL_4533 [Mucilaginibacter xinganensis]